MSERWQDRANCKGLDTNMFFPELGKSHFVAKKIKAICAECPVKEPCLELGMAFDESKVGYFGGLSGNQRRALREQRMREKAQRQ